MTMVVLVTDRIYRKTRRYVEKIRACIGEATDITLAHVSGFPEGLPVDCVRDCVSKVIFGSVDRLAQEIDRHLKNQSGPVSILALNQSSIVPAVAIRRLLGMNSRNGYLESCDKSRTRRLLSERGGNLAMDFCVATPGQRLPDTENFIAEKYVVKPTFGMSSSDVRIFDSWNTAREYAESLANSKEWLPDHVASALDLGRTDTRIIEPYIDGTEFSVDGWIIDRTFKAIVHHKLFMVRRAFIGDGVTVSPPLSEEYFSAGWLELKNSEETICNFGRSVLDAVGFCRGVFHMEGIERHSDRKLFPIEINPRAPGGSLWKSAFKRFGYDLELVDVLIQLGRPIPSVDSWTPKYVLHYPYYASTSGILCDWGDLDGPKARDIDGLTIDFAANPGDEFREKDLWEEPYLAFAVISDDTIEGLLKKWEGLRILTPPQVAYPPANRSR